MSKNKKLYYVDDDFYDESPFEEMLNMTYEEEERMNECVAQVLSVLDGMEMVSTATIRETLWFYYFDVSKTVDYILCEILPKLIAQKEAIKNKPTSNFHRTNNTNNLDRSTSKGTSLSKTPKSQNLSAETEISDKLENTKLEKNIIKTPTNKAHPLPQLKIKDVVSKHNQSNHKENLNLVVIGHVDAGKSTLMGHLLYLMGEVSESKLRKFKKESENIGKKSFAYAWVLDATQEERDRGVTIDVASTRFTTEKYVVNLLDAPGHRDFIPNMITGASQAETAILVIDGAEGGFESGFDNKNSQTKEHALLVRSLGFQHLIVAINKLESVDWSQQRFNEICDKLSSFLNQNGFKKCNVKYIPCSGLKGVNLFYKDHKRSQPLPKELAEWYNGDSIVETIDKCVVPKRPIEKSLRMPVYDYHKGGVSGMSSSLVFCNGKLQQGNLQVGQAILLLPKRSEGIVKSIKLNDQDVEYCVCGNQVTIGIDRIEINDFQPGSLLCDPANPDLAHVATEMLCQIMVFDISVPILNGCSVIVHHQNINVPGRIKKILNTISKTDGTPLKKNPRHLSKKESALVQIKVDEPLCVDKFECSKEMSRVLIRRAGETIATGIVVDVIDNNNQPH